MESQSTLLDTIGEVRSLQVQLQEIEDLARAVENGESQHRAALRMRGLDVLEILEGRIARESIELRSAMRASPLPDSNRQAERLVLEEQEQRLLLGLQLVALADPERPDGLVARGVREFVHWMRIELGRAVHTAGDAHALCDDVFLEVETA